MDEADAQHSAAPGELVAGISSAVVNIEWSGLAAADDGRMQYLLAGTQGLIAEPAAMHQQPAVVVNNQEEPRPLAA